MTTSLEERLNNGNGATLDEKERAIEAASKHQIDWINDRGRSDPYDDRSRRSTVLTEMN